MHIRAKVTLVFTAVMAVVLVRRRPVRIRAVPIRSRRDDRRRLRVRAGDVIALVHHVGSGFARSGPSPLTEEGENLAQIIDRIGEVLDAPPRLRQASLRSPRNLARARTRTMLLDVVRAARSTTTCARSPHRCKCAIDV
jgi:hypothetical protein